MIKNKNPYIIITAICMLSIGIYSCRKEMTSIPEMKHEAQWAKSYFNDVLLPKSGNQVSYKMANKLSSIKERETKPNQKTPLWTRASIGKTALYEFVEVPLSYNRKIVTLIGPKDMKADPEIIKASFNRLIIFKDKKGKINQRIVSFIPDKDYLRRHNGDISHNKIDHLDPDFNGFLVYKTWDDVTVNRLRIVNGKAVSLKKVKATSSSFKLNKSASTDRTTSERPGYEGEPGCIDWYDVTWEIICYYMGDDPIPYYCSDPIIVSEIYLKTTCPDGEEGPDCEDPVNFTNPDCETGCRGCDTDPDFSPDFGSPTNIDKSSTGETYEVMGIDTFKVRNVSWLYHYGLEYSFESTERAAVKISGGPRKFHSLVHQGVDYTGSTTNYEVTLDKETFTPQVQDSSGQMHARYKIMIDAEVAGIKKHYVSEYYDSYGHWDTYFQFF